MSDTAMPFPSKEKKTMLFNMLKVLGGHRVIVHFQGGGDSGEIEQGILYDANEKEIDMTGITYDWDSEQTNFDPQTNKWVTVESTNQTELSDILRIVTETMLENEGLDWYNNDGGQGQLTIDLTKTPPTVVLTVGLNYTSTEEHEFDFTEDEDEDEETVTSKEGK